MKKFIAIILTLTMLCMTTACGSDSDNSKLQSEYDQLKQDYEALKADYDELKGMNSENVTEPTTETITEVDSEILPLEIKDYGYYMSGKYLYCSVVMYNPNKNIMCEFPSYRVTARDADGVVLGSNDHTMSKIYPEQTIAFSKQFFECDETPTSVEVEALAVADYALHKVGSPDTPEFKPLEISNTAIRNDKVVGEISNPNSEDYRQIAVTVIFRDSDGKIVSGETTFVDDLKANSTVPFQISTDHRGFTVTDNYEVSAQLWG